MLATTAFVGNAQKTPMIAISSIAHQGKSRAINRKAKTIEIGSEKLKVSIVTTLNL